MKNRAVRAAFLILIICLALSACSRQFLIDSGMTDAEIDAFLARITE